MFDPVNRLSTLFSFFMFLSSVILAFIPYWVYRHKRKQFKSEGYIPYDYEKFEHFCDEFPWRSMGVMAVGIVAALAFGTCIIFEVYDTVDNRINEPVYYSQMIAEGDTLEDAISNSEDIINTELYTSIVGYNRRLADIKMKASLPAYSWNFTGIHDWDAIPYIELE